MLYRRLFIALIVSIVLAALCWLILPRLGVTMPWWVPLIGFIVIILSAVLAPGVSDEQDDPDASLPFRPPEDEGEGISAADRERFG